MSTMRSPVVAFVGTTPNIGTTTAAFATAYRIAESSGGQVGYLCLHLKSAKIHRFIGVDEPMVTLDKLKPELTSCSLTTERLLRAVHTVKGLPNLHVLFGNRLRDHAEFAKPEEFEHLITVAEQTFSIIIIDAGAYWDNAATVCALRRASSRIVVTTDALSHFQEDGSRWIGQVSPLFGIASERYDTLVIHYPWSTGGYRMKEICKEMGTVRMGELRLTDSLFSQLDSGRYADWLKEDTAGKKLMRQPANLLMNRYGIRSNKPSIMTQPWYRKLLAHRNGVGS